MSIKRRTYQGCSALVTGGSSGIGLATAALLASQGANVWLIARDVEKLKAAQKTVEGARSNPSQRVGFTSSDLSKVDEARSAIDQVVQAIGVPDVVINSAGISHPGYAQEISLDMFHEVVDVDFFGTVHVVQLLLPEMIKRRSGNIVNISSVAGFMGVFGYSAYGAAKYAIRGYSEVLRAELKPFGIGVSVVFPPDTDTPQLAYENTIKPMETKELSGNAGLMSAEAVAKSILKGVRQGRFAILPGSESKLYYWLTGWLGGGLYPVMDMMIAQAQKKKLKGQQP